METLGQITLLVLFGHESYAHTEISSSMSSIPHTSTTPSS